MDVIEWQARAIENAGELMAFALSTTQEDRVDWKPAADPKSDTRSALDVAAECIGVNRRLAAQIRGEAPGERNTDRTFKTCAEAREQLRASAHEVAEALRAEGESVMAREFPTPYGNMPGAMIIQICANNMVYHFGQINYIQRLYGDTEFRIPGR